MEYTDKIEAQKGSVLIDCIEVCNEANFMKYFQIPKVEQFWRSLCYIQTCVKAKKGFGKGIVVDFFAPLDL